MKVLVLYSILISNGDLLRILHKLSRKFVDSSNIKEMFTGAAAAEQFGHPPWPRGGQQHAGHHNGYSMIEETDIDAIDRAFRPKYRQ